MALPAANDLETAFLQIAQVLNEVEDQLTSIPYNPTDQADGRMYPPQQDSRRKVPDFPRVMRYRSKSHNTFIAINGAIEIRTVAGEQVLFQKPGANGKGVWQA